jgi:hypothetical protein
MRPLALLCVLAALACGGDDRLPRELLGRWVTDDPRYAGRSLSLSQHSIIFAADQTAAESFSVRGVETRRDDDGSTAYKIAYGSDGSGELVLRLRLSAATPATLTIGDRGERWAIAPRNAGRP